MSIQSFSPEYCKIVFTTQLERIYSKAASLNRKIYKYASTFFQSLPTLFFNLPKKLSLLQKPSLAAQRNKIIYSQAFSSAQNSLKTLLPYLSGISKVSYFIQSCKSSVFPSKNIPSFFSSSPSSITPVPQESSRPNSSSVDDSTPLEVSSPSEDLPIVPFTHSSQTGSPTTYTDRISQTWQQLLSNRDQTDPILYRPISEHFRFNPLQLAHTEIKKITKLGESSTPLYFPANLLQTTTIGSFHTTNGQFHLTLIHPQANDSLYGSYKIELEGVRQPIHAHLVRSKEETRLSRTQDSSTLPLIRLNEGIQKVKGKLSTRDDSTTQQKKWQSSSRLLAGTVISVFCIGSGMWSVAVPSKEVPIILPKYPPKAPHPFLRRLSGLRLIQKPIRKKTQIIENKEATALQRPSFFSHWEATPPVKETTQKPQNKEPNPFNWKNVVLVASIASVILASVTISQTRHR